MSCGGGCGCQGCRKYLRRPRRLPEPQEEALFRIVQEALNNVARHAGATSVAISLEFEPTDVRVSIVESVVIPDVWTITIANLDTGGSFALTLPYASSHATAEWVIETPVVISGTSVTVGPMPDLAVVHFDAVTANGNPAGLIPQEQIRLVDFDLSPIAAPSLPDREADGFNDCTDRKTCPAPGNEIK